ncbi:MAG: splG [Firmicutes bacterium]|nr:splG [Bacillota bacterium]
MQRFVPVRAYFEPRSVEYPLGKKLYNQLTDMGVSVRMTSSHNRVTGLPGKSSVEAYCQAKQTLVVGVRQIRDFATCKPSAHYQIPLATSCPGMCEYCYLATTLGKRPYLRVYVNIEEILEKAQKYIHERQPEITVFEGAATSDPIPTEYLTGLLYRTIEFFGLQPNAKFRFVTKHTDIDSLLTARHNGNTRFRFSLNTQTAISRYEHATPSLEKRVEAAVKVAEAGYPLGFIIAPIFFAPGWQEEYGGLITDLAVELPESAKRNLTFEFITHRFTKRAKATITEVFPNTQLPLAEDERKYKFGQFGYGKYIYDPDTMEEIKSFLVRRLAERFPAAKVEYFV